MANIKEFEYKAEMKQLLNLIIHSLYTHPEIFLRELISNSSDALNKVRFMKLQGQNVLDSEDELKISIGVDSKAGTFYLEDNGIGMTEDELVNNIGTIAHSGTLEFLKNMKEQGKAVDDAMIGRFGVGFYSVFMVTDEVTIETRYADPSSKGYKWKSQGDSKFAIEEVDKKTKGTKISFKFKENFKDYSHEYKIEEVINKYSNFAEFPIYLKEIKINKVTALWHKKKNEVTDAELNEFYKFITNSFDNPLGHIHLSIEGNVNFKGLLFIPENAPMNIFRMEEGKSAHLYANKILIQSDCKELLPEYLRFVRGVVDTIDLPLNVSREITQNSPLMEKINNILTNEIISFLSKWAENDKDKYEIFYKSFSRYIKAGVEMDFKNHDKLVELLRFESSSKKPGELISLKDYIKNMKSDQKEIYYLSGEGRSAVEKSPNLEYFKKNEIEVLLLTEAVDAFIINSINEYDKKPVKAIDKSDIDIISSRIEKPDDNLSKSLINQFKNVLKDKVEDVVISKRLVDSAATLVRSKTGMDPQVERMMELMNKDFKRSKRVMEINIDHPLIANLSKIFMANPNDLRLEKCILQLYEGALFVEGSLPQSTDFIKRMNELMEEATRS